MALLPPPIRCFGPDPNIDFSGQPNVAQQFTDMTEKLKGEDYRMVQQPRGQEQQDKLVLQSLQGNWSHRHHPYRPQEKNHREDYRSREGHHNDYKNNQGPHSRWRARGHKKGGNYHR